MADLPHHWLGGFVLLALLIVAALAISRALWLMAEKAVAALRARLLPPPVAPIDSTDFFETEYAPSANGSPMADNKKAGA